MKENHKNKQVMHFKTIIEISLRMHPYISLLKQKIQGLPEPILQKKQLFYHIFVFRTTSS